VDFWKSLYKKDSNPSFKKNLKAVLGFTPGNLSLYKTALTHRSVKDGIDENNERLEYLGDAVLSALVADYLFKRYPYKGEGFLTEMRSKMVNRQQLNDIALKMGLKKVTAFNKSDASLKSSQIFGNTMEALVVAVYLDKG
jgi:ribonuclease-3